MSEPRGIPGPKPRPRSETRVKTSVELPRELHDQIRKAAAERDLSVSQMVRAAMRQSLAASAAPATEPGDD